MGVSGRVYGGRSEAERRADRRARLLAAGLELFGTDGWAGTSIERLCSAASVATRSFYEEFASREQLLLTVYDSVMEDAAQAVRDAVTRGSGDPLGRTRAGVAAYVGHLTEDPRRAQIVNRELRAAYALPEVRRHRQLTLNRMAELVEQEVVRRAVRAEPERRRVLALALAGAVNEVLGDWVSHPEPRPPVEPLVEELAFIYVAVLGSPGPGEPPGRRAGAHDADDGA
ncbi:MAG: TetR/AcrR family transcriptional regulator [Actinomycetota bacterium]|nr:TetR/AcrR family transcriptional regulator [Actinomycetota bacterium]